jgi:hypothetical protein
MEAERDYSRRILDTVAALHRDARRSRLTLVKKEANLIDPHGVLVSNNVLRQRERDCFG